MKNNLLEEFIFNDDLSDEAIYLTYHFLETLLLEFEKIGFHRMRRHLRKQRNTPPCQKVDFTKEDPF
jgi:hypothetical protein